MNQQPQAHTRKTLVAKSTATYRGFFLIETPDGGYTFFLGEKQYDFLNLTEASNCIDAMYARISVGKKESLPTA